MPALLSMDFPPMNEFVVDARVLVYGLLVIIGSFIFLVSKLEVAAFELSKLNPLCIDKIGGLLISLSLLIVFVWCIEIPNCPSLNVSFLSA